MARRYTRKARRFRYGVTHDPLVELVYRREAWVFRRAMQWWATPEQMHRLNAALARRFSVPVPRLILRLSRNPRHLGGHTKVDPSTGRAHIFVRGCHTSGVWETGLLNNKCEHATLQSHVVRGEYRIHTLLHEWAHYLGFLWRANGKHDALFCAIDEVTHEWFARQSKCAFLRRAVKVVPVRLTA